MDAMPMVVECAKRQPLYYDNKPVEVKLCLVCNTEIQYDWVRSPFCSLCDMLKELARGEDIRWEPRS